MQMKPLLAVLLPVKGLYVGYATAGRRSVRGNSKSALLGNVCGSSAFAPAFIHCPWHKRAYNMQWISERNAGSFREYVLYPDFVPSRN